jgi:hypothetical protein
MNFAEFLQTYDKPASVVLLEGKREINEADKQKLIDLGILLAKESKHIIFRSGNAPGADELFAKGIAMLDNTRLEVVLPYSGHRAKQNFAYSAVSIEDVNLAKEPEIVYESKANKKTEKLIDSYVSGDINKVSIKAAYILRDTIKVMGSSDSIRAAAFGIFYDDLENPKQGGTGHTMNVCISQGVPYISQDVWLNWLID